MWWWQHCQWWRMFIHLPDRNSLELQQRSCQHLLHFRKHTTLTHHQQDPQSTQQELHDSDSASQSTTVNLDTWEHATVCHSDSHQCPSLQWVKNLKTQSSHRSHLRLQSVNTWQERQYWVRDQFQPKQRSILCDTSIQEHHHHGSSQQQFTLHVLHWRRTQQTTRCRSISQCVINHHFCHIFLVNDSCQNHRFVADRCFAVGLLCSRSTRQHQRLVGTFHEDERNQRFQCWLVDRKPTTAWPSLITGYQLIVPQQL